MSRPTPATGSLSRHAEDAILAALDDTRIVAVIGPRQSGKTTLARKIAADRNMDFVTLDDEQSRQFALDDPSGFIRDLDRAVIDEVQRVPALILALKHAVDETPRAGRFLLIGSVDLFRGTVSPDSLAGRVEAVELLPFSQSEIERGPTPEFIARMFRCEHPQGTHTGRTGDLTERVLAGGYPEALARHKPARRRAWLKAYAHALTTRDIIDLAAVVKTDDLSRLLEHAAIASGQLVNASALSASLGVDSKTVDRWLTLLEHMFVVRRLRAWHRNDVKRLIRTPKLHFLDSGLLSALRNVDAQVLRADRKRFGALLEGFVYSELVKQSGIADDEVRLSHYRDKDKMEVDFVLEMGGKVAGVEVKAAASVTPRDFRGLKRLQEASGSAFACGVVLYDGARTQRAGDRLFAVPVSQLWD